MSYFTDSNTDRSVRRRELKNGVIRWMSQPFLFCPYIYLDRPMMHDDSDPCCSGMILILSLRPFLCFF